MHVLSQNKTGVLEINARRQDQIFVQIVRKVQTLRQMALRAFALRASITLLKHVTFVYQTTDALQLDNFRVVLMNER